jgi:hypothetical protein
LLQGAASLFSLAQHCVAGSLAAFFVSEVYTSFVSSMSPPDVDSARHAGLFSFCRVASAGLSFDPRKLAKPAMQIGARNIICASHASASSGLPWENVIVWPVPQSF